MIIAERKLDYSYLKDNISNTEKIVDYAIGLVPKWARHIESVVDNQRYYVAIHLRNMLSIPYKLRSNATNKLIDGITISGMMSDFVTIDEILNECNKEQLVQALLWSKRNEKR